MHDDQDPTQISARNEVEIELSELWALPAGLVRTQLNNALWLDEHFPFLRDLAADGRVDQYRVKLIVEAARHGLDTPEEWAGLARRIESFLTKHLRSGGILGCSHRQLRNRLAYVIKLLRAADAEARFRNAHGLRSVEVNDGDDGISWLTLAGTTDQVQLAAHRLDLSARAARAAGDPRTLTQLRTDLALDLLINGSTGEAPVPQFARPIINLTVPIQTVMGLSDHPGTLSGGKVVPAGLARVIAQRPGATWHRMLTDPAGTAVELSTERYVPTRAIWEHVVSTQSTCFRSNCDHESTACDLDHRTPWPLGPTSTSNLWPGCRTDHRAKHSDGFSIEQTENGGFALRTPAGFRYATTQDDHPSSDDWEEPPVLIQFSATELHEALSDLRRRNAESRPERPEIAWEFDIDISWHPAA
ncbi:HNH endonuclease signature motif containing protein [Nocardioides marmorisolisilvae]|uniref:HNH endonuclease n=1 Tax=Nocardioides marmorisolisilvae TaxID=1542737 RepID=A0A3N0DV31_9ACTN|nr:HNH endonuclease signature motif containing protein [Nocardioides marmorisolisilvae]RNL79460.1 HNH endonuclease [Nocardioides marmorisolisilvae]